MLDEFSIEVTAELEAEDSEEHSELEAPVPMGSAASERAHSSDTLLDRTLDAQLADSGVALFSKTETSEASDFAPPPDTLAATTTSIPAIGETDDATSIGNQDDPLFGYDDELILQLRVVGTSATETIIAYGARDGTYLPVGELSRLLDLPIQISDDGNYASGWYLSEDRTVFINLREGTIELQGRTIQLDQSAGQAFDGETFLRADLFAEIFPLEVETDLRSQAIILTTLEPFPFEERMRRRAERERLSLRANSPEQAAWPREELPWAALSFPIIDAELRAVSDVPRGERFESDLRIAGDFAFLTAQAYVSATTRDGLTAALVELGRRDADGDLLGPLQATEFALGDVATLAMPVGLRGASGRGAFVTNQALDGFSVFDEIDFRGVLLDGYEVELYRNDILLGSTRERVNGQYEFLQIPVDYGLNVFRLIFYGPQGQRREEVRRISVGDGRLASGGLQYSAGIVERSVNLLGVEGPDFRPDTRFGDLQAVAEVSYGLNSSITVNASGAMFEDRGADRWIATGGLRSGLGGLAILADAAFSDGGGTAFGVGLGGRALGGGFRLTHFEYSGPFIDELRATGTQPLTRATEVDFNTSIDLGNDLYVPLTLRGRRTAFQDGRVQTNASLRASARFSGLIASSAVSYIELSTPTGSGFDQALASFDLATFNRSSTQLRGSVGFRLFPDTAITQAAAEVSHALDDRTVLRASAGYAFENGGATLGFSAVREFDRFSLALDSQYDFERDDHVIALRLNLSFGRDPVRNSFFVAQPGMAGSGAVSVRAFHDLDGDHAFSAGDVPLPDVTISSANASTLTDEFGRARLGQLGNGNRVVIQLDPSSLPDIYMSPVNRGIQVEPRAGRFQTLDFAVVELSEVEGIVSFQEEESERGVSGLRLQMYDETGELVDYVRTERGGYFFFERVPPGTYSFIIDPEQAERLDLCLSAQEPLLVASVSEIYNLELKVQACEPELRDLQTTGS
ncbi:hypothetical protein D6201_07010 [Aurantiacibacter aquimixticola]|uniref:Carboxypeptidase regulatory-like domain-containing protein n=1 Tax=Aurantiacibacter aquimixticola TaxID=1958945 RepID=A0A419RTM8_9SPHN|nr:hypothetical protein D6201_07010 [Aurantiacibacter aquimixticola]